MAGCHCAFGHRPLHCRPAFLLSYARRTRQCGDKRFECVPFRYSAGIKRPRIMHARSFPAPYASGSFCGFHNGTFGFKTGISLLSKRTPSEKLTSPSTIHHERCSPALRGSSRCASMIRKCVPLFPAQRVDMECGRRLLRIGGRRTSNSVLTPRLQRRENDDQISSCL